MCIRDRVKMLQDAYDQLNQFALEKSANGESITDDLQSLYAREGEQTDVSRMLRLMGEKYNTTIVIVDSMDNTMVPSMRDARFLAELVQQYILGRQEPGTETLIKEDNYKIQKRFDMRSKSYYLQNWGFFEDNRTIFIMSMPLSLIHIYRG